jgi:hypothetical protein
MDVWVDGELHPIQQQQQQQQQQQHSGVWHMGCSQKKANTGQRARMAARLADPAEQKGKGSCMFGSAFRLCFFFMLFSDSAALGSQKAAKKHSWSAGPADESLGASASHAPDCDVLPQFSKSSSPLSHPSGGIGPDRTLLSPSQIQDSASADSPVAHKCVG